MYTQKDMQYITTTQLRTMSSELIEALKRGDIVSLIHRSKVVGSIKPSAKLKIFTKESMLKLKKLAEELNLPKLSYEEREKRYRKHLMEKYGKNLS
jgi:antitoxin (DNA-binding transcriptional repressor) of toxin-antitoxin stability system